MSSCISCQCNNLWWEQNPSWIACCGSSFLCEGLAQIPAATLVSFKASALALILSLGWESPLLIQVSMANFRTLDTGIKWAIKGSSPSADAPPSGRTPSLCSNHSLWLGTNNLSGPECFVWRNEPLILTVPLLAVEATLKHFHTWGGHYLVQFPPPLSWLSRQALLLVPITLFPEQPLPRLQSLLLSSDVPPSTLAPRLQGFPGVFSPFCIPCRNSLPGGNSGALWSWNDTGGGLTPPGRSCFSRAGSFFSAECCVAEDVPWLNFWEIRFWNICRKTDTLINFLWVFHFLRRKAMILIMNINNLKAGD